VGTTELKLVEEETFLVFEVLKIIDNFGVGGKFPSFWERI
jgi:hypothetical protein